MKFKTVDEYVLNEIRRDLAISEKTGKPTRFWSFSKGNKIYGRMK